MATVYSNFCYPHTHCTRLTVSSWGICLWSWHR